MDRAKHPTGPSLRAWLKSNNLNVTQAAELCDVTRRHMHRYLNDHRDPGAVDIPYSRWRLLESEQQNLSKPIP